MTWIFTMKSRAGRGTVEGECAHCKKPVYESLFTLDDCYNVWAGKCPHCGAVNFLAMSGLRGYSSSGMILVLPTDEEREANEELPQDCPTSGPCGKPATMHGTIAGELYHQLAQKAPAARE